MVCLACLGRDVGGVGRVGGVWWQRGCGLRIGAEFLLRTWTGESRGLYSRLHYTLEINATFVMKGNVTVYKG